MSVVSTPTTNAWQARSYLITALLVGGSINGFAVRIMESWHQNGAEALFFGISPFELITLFIAAGLTTQHSTNASPRIGWLEALILIGIMLPSSVLSWVFVAIYAGVTASRTSGEQRLGALLFLGLALCSLWSSVVIKWFALPLTSADAYMVWSILSLFRNDLVLSGNVMGMATGHKVVLLVACSTAYALPKALLALCAFAAASYPFKLSRFFSCLAIVSVFLAFANWTRLAVMTWSAEYFEIAHGAIGANIFDVGQAAIILATGYWLAQR